MAVSGALHQIFRFVFCYACVFYCVNNFILKPARLKAKQAQAQAAPAEAGEVQRVTRPPHVNAWPRGSKLALQLYLSDGAHFERPHLDPSAGGAAVVPATDAAAASRGLVATAEGLVYGAADEADCSHTVSLTLEPTYELRANRSQLWLHAYVSVVPPPGIATVPAAAAVTEAHVPLVRQQKVRRKSSTKRLLSGEEAGGGEVEGGDGAGGGQGNPPGGHALPSTSADPAPDHAAAPDHEAAPDDRAAPAEGGGGGSAGREVALGGSGDGEAASGGGGGGGGGAESSLIDVMRVLHSTGTGEFDVFPHWAGGAVRLDLLSDFTSFPPNGIPPQMRHALRVEPATGAYTPPLYVNELWSLRSGMPRLNASTGSLNLTVSVAPTSLVKWQLGMQMTQSLEMQAAVHGDEMVEEMRRMLLETNPWLLGLTMAVSLLHSLFDFLAFKNDVQFWRDNKSMKGISLNSLLINLFIQAVIFLYLLDSDTSWVILLSNGVGLLIEAWKLRKIVKSVALRWPAWSWRPRLQLTAADSYVLSDTKAHDEEAMAYLGRVIAPLAVGYASYSLLYNEHKSWYSWLLRAVVGCVYSFGFIKMTPQLFINYRLKSTAHMPWKTFMYKALNTFVDDLFAFVITMPTMHRLSCLRDDLIFVVYLYQRWTYGVDSRRANEFGQVGEEEGSEALPAPPQAPGSTAPVDADGKPKAE